MMAIAIGKILGFELTENFQRHIWLLVSLIFGIVGIYHYLLGSKTMSIFLWEVVDAQDYATIKIYLLHFSLAAFGMEQIGHLSFGAAYMEYTKSLKKHLESKSANMDIWENSSR